MKIEAQTKVELRRQDYNENRTHSPGKLIRMGARSLSWNLLYLSPLKAGIFTEILSGIHSFP